MSSRPVKRQKTSKKANESGEEVAEPVSAAPSSSVHQFAAPFDAKTVPIAVYHPAALVSSLVIVAHGAGGNHNSPDIVAVSAGLSAQLGKATGVLAFTATSSSLPSRVKQINAVLEWSKEQFPKVEQLVLVGKSMGCRVAAKAALELDPDKKIAGLVFMSYPLVAGGTFAALKKHKEEGANAKGKVKAEKPDERKSLLLDLARERSDVALLFVAGTEDPMLPAEQLESVLEAMDNQINVVKCEGADHGLSLKGKGAAARTKELQEAYVKATADFVKEKLGDGTLRGGKVGRSESKLEF